MAPSTPNEHPSDSVRILEAQIREVFGRTVYSHKVHEKCADGYLVKHRSIKFWQIVLSAVTTTSLLLALFGDSRPATIVGAALSTILFALSAYTKDFDFGELAQRHTNTANRLWAIREAYFSLLTDLAAGLVSLEEIIRQRDQLQHRLEDVHKGAPRTNPRAYTAAQKALKIDEELTFGDHEIDAFLPTELRRSARASRTNGNAGLSQEQRQIPA